jgi:hypothetical protein
MTPKEKAKELFDKYTKFQNGYGYEYKAKQCALIAVDELILYAHNNYYHNYWQEVKQEINNL